MLGQEPGRVRPATAELEDAVRTLNLSGLPGVVRAEKGREAAILLKEILDRVIVVNLSQIPDLSANAEITFWISW